MSGPGKPPNVELDDLLALDGFFRFLGYSMNSYPKMDAAFGEMGGHLWTKYAGAGFDMARWFCLLDEGNKRKLVEWYNEPREITASPRDLYRHEEADFVRVGQPCVAELQRLVDDHREKGENASKASQKRQRAE